MSTPNIPQAPQQTWPQPVAPRTNGLAIASLVLGICGFALLPVIFGHIALKQIRVRGEGGSGLAIAGLVLGYLGVVAWIVGIVLVGIAIAGGVIYGAR
jgi:peptidyl-prolyl cis-trans isomerase B (cyclophilin B)